MTCDNFTGYVNNLNDFCGDDIDIVKEDCNILCMLSIMVILNECVDFLIFTDKKSELKSVIKWCYYKKTEMNIYGGDSHRRLTQMTDFNINELMLFIVGVLGAFGGLCVVIQRSKCETCCWGLMKRNVDAVIADEKLKLTGHSGNTPRLETQPEIPETSA